MESRILINRLMVQKLWVQYSTADRENIVRRILERIDNEKISLEQEGRQLQRQVKYETGHQA